VAYVALQNATPNLVGASDVDSFTPMGSLTHSERNAAPVGWATTCHSVSTVHEIYVQYLRMVSPLSQSRLSSSIVTVSATSGIISTVRTSSHALHSVGRFHLLYIQHTTRKHTQPQNMRNARPQEHPLY
jgi:hypothetical protein